MSPPYGFGEHHRDIDTLKDKLIKLIPTILLLRLLYNDERSIWYREFL